MKDESKEKHEKFLKSIKERKYQEPTYNFSIEEIIWEIKDWWSDNWIILLVVALVFLYGIIYFWTEYR